MALHAKAKAEAGYRFYALYDKISREDILAHAYAQCRANKGAAGVDGQDFADIEAYGVQRWLGELALALKQETYRPEPIRRVFIPKANGKLRPLGISTLRDRVCMSAALLVLEPIFEADLPPEQYAYRPGRNAQKTVVEVEAQLFRGHPEVVDADLADYFGSIPHAELLKSVARRVVDRRVLHLIKMWLDCPVEETDDRGRQTRTTEARDNRRGIPQGSPISPLLANIYMPPNFSQAEAIRAHKTADQLADIAASGNLMAFDMIAALSTNNGDVLEATGRDFRTAQARVKSSLEALPKTTAMRSVQNTTLSLLALADGKTGIFKVRQQELDADDYG